MEVSIIIPTYNRPDDLKEALDSILKQTTLPREVIIVDDSDTHDTAKLVEGTRREIEGKGISLRYIRKVGAKCISASRNVGVRNATEDVILNLDDDVVLDENFIEQILKVYRVKPNAIGVQGYITNYTTSWLKNNFNKLFFLVHYEKNTNYLLPSIQHVYAMPLDKIINCQWMVGNNMSFKKKVFETYMFDENLKQASYNEDSDLSYRIYQAFPYSLYQTPFARLVHKGSKYRMMDKQSTYRWQVYQAYLFYKNIDQTFKNKLIFLWSRIGLLIAAFGVAILGLPEHRALNFGHLLDAYILCLKNLYRIKLGNLGFLDRTG